MYIDQLIELSPVPGAVFGHGGEMLATNEHWRQPGRVFEWMMLDLPFEYPLAAGANPAQTLATLLDGYEDEAEFDWLASIDPATLVRISMRATTWDGDRVIVVFVHPSSSDVSRTVLGWESPAHSLTAVDASPAMTTNSIPQPQNLALEPVELVEVDLRGSGLISHARKDPAATQDQSSPIGPGPLQPIVAPATDRADTHSAVMGLGAAHELVSWFQPIVSTQTGAVVGAEALIRWVHPEAGVLAAGSFLPLITDLSLLDDVLDIALNSALAGWGQIVRESGAGELGLLLNMSPRQLLREGSIEEVAALATRHGIDLNTIVVELTEDSLEAASDLSHVLVRAHELGFRVVLDDFGTGHSSVGRLRSLVVDGIKVDQGLLRGAELDPRAWQILASTISLAAAISVDCIVEGVETAAERDVLDALEVQFAQGYFYGYPQSASEFVSLLEKPSPVEAGRL